MLEAFAENISGYWEFATEPVWVEINLKQGKGNAARNVSFTLAWHRVDTVPVNSTK